MSFLQHFSFASRKNPRRGPFLFGATIGLLATLAYLICGGDVFLFVPPWASVIFFPGFLVGNWTYTFVGFDGAIIIGVLAVMMTYGLLALVIRLLLTRRIKPS